MRVYRAPPTSAENFMKKPSSLVYRAVISDDLSGLFKNPLHRSLYSALNLLLKKAVFADTQSPENLRNLFPANFHNNLKELLVKIIIDNHVKWRETAINRQVSLPHLVDFDWRVDIKAASGTISRMSVPTCLVQFEVQDVPSKVGTTAPVTCANIELSKETLNTMLDGLSKIRDQLSSVAKQG